MNDWKAWEPVHPMENGAEIEIGGGKCWKEIEISGENNWKLKILNLKEMKTQRDQNSKKFKFR